LKDESAHDSHYDSLYPVLTLTTNTYMKALMKDENAPDDHSNSLYQASP